MSSFKIALIWSAAIYPLSLKMLDLYSDEDHEKHQTHYRAKNRS